MEELRYSPKKNAEATQLPAPKPTIEVNNMVGFQPQAISTGENEVREIRINPVVPSESVLVATARGMRPKQQEKSVVRDERTHVAHCPFCVGNEHLTPPTITAHEEDGCWQIRIVENLYPVVADDTARANLTLGMQQVIDGYGRHEVIIDHPQHGALLHQMGTGHLARLFAAYRDRMQMLYRSNSRLRYVLIFKNFGLAAGASIRHTHSQIIALPVVPENVQQEVLHSHIYYKKHHQCVFCSLIDEALTFEATVYCRASGAVRRRIEVAQYVVERGQRFIAIKPFASRYEWEVHIFPLHHQADFLAADDEDLADLAEVLQRTMARLEAVLDGVQYNYFLHTAPHEKGQTTTAASYHWHLEICPRTSIPTGFELGSGLFVNTISPESAAKTLRDAKPATRKAA